MPQRLIMPDPFHRLQQRLFIHDAAFLKSDLHMIALRDDLLQHLGLDLAHEPHAQLLILRLIRDMQLRILLGQLLQVSPHHRCIAAFGQDHAIAHR